MRQLIILILDMVVIVRLVIAVKSKKFDIEESMITCLLAAAATILSVTNLILQ